MTTHRTSLKISSYSPGDFLNKELVIGILLLSIGFGAKYYLKHRYTKGVVLPTTRSVVITTQPTTRALKVAYPTTKGVSLTTKMVVPINKLNLPSIKVPVSTRPVENASE